MFDSTDRQGECLLIDTCGDWITVGWNGHRQHFSREVFEPRGAFVSLFPLIHEVMAEAGSNRADWIVCTVGPGSFTGVRIGVGAARTLAMLWNVPLMGIDNLTYTLFSLTKELEESHGPIVVLLDAKQKRAYAKTVFEPNRFMNIINATSHDTEIYPYLSSLPDGCRIYGDNPEILLSYMNEEEVRGYGCKIKRLPDPKSIHLYELALAIGGREKAAHWESVLPLYLRTDPAHAKYPAGFNRNKI